MEFSLTLHEINATTSASKDRLLREFRLDNSRRAYLQSTFELFRQDRAPVVTMSGALRSALNPRSTAHLSRPKLLGAAGALSRTFSISSMISGVSFFNRESALTLSSI